MTDNSQLEDQLAEVSCTLEKAFNSGHLGALQEIIYQCEQHNHVLPSWANQALLRLMGQLFQRDSDIPKQWNNWLKRHLQDYIDYQRYGLVLKAKESRAEHAQALNIAASIIKNDSDAGIKHAHAVKYSYDNVCERIETEPYRYLFLPTFTRFEQENGTYDRLVNLDLWLWIQNEQKTAKPKPKKNKRL